MFDFTFNSIINGGLVTQGNFSYQYMSLIELNFNNFTMKRSINALPKMLKNRLLSLILL